MVWTWVAGRLSRGRSTRPAPRATSTPAELRAHLPLLWPDGPDGPLDEAALSALSRGYARAGRTAEELLADLDVLCSVVGVETSSRMIEASTTTWSDAFLDGVASKAAAVGDSLRPSGPADTEALDEVRRVLDGANAGTPWGDLVPSARLLLVTWDSEAEGGDRRPSREELARVAAEVRRLFPRSPVASQRDQRRVVAAVSDSSTLSGRVAALEARCGELSAGTPPTVALTPASTDPTVVGRLLRPTG